MGTQFTEQFREFLKTETDPGLRRLREDAFAAFTQLGFPAVKSEDWKYTNVAPIAKETWDVPPSSDFSPEGEKSEERLAAFNFSRNGFAALNLAFADFKIIRIARNTNIVEPIEGFICGR